MNLRRLTGPAVGLALSLAVVLPAAADFGDDIRENLVIPTHEDFDVVVETPDFSFPGDDDDDDDGDDRFVVSLPDSSDVGDAVREDTQSLADQIRESVGIGGDE